MIGDSSVGKTSLVLRYDKRGFNLRFTTTIGVDYSDRLLELDGRQVKLQVRQRNRKRFATSRLDLHVYASLYKRCCGQGDCPTSLPLLLGREVVCVGGCVFAFDRL